MISFVGHKESLCDSFLTVTKKQHEMNPQICDCSLLKGKHFGATKVTRAKLSVYLSIYLSIYL